jgi:hypothetical protein
VALFDTERVLKNAVEIVKAKLGAEITAVDTEKNDFKLAPIDAKAFYFGQLPKAFNYNPMLVYGFENNPTLESAQLDNHIKVISLYFEVVIVDGGSKDDENIIYKLLRYSRALENVFIKNYPKIMEGYGNIQVTSLVPTTLFSLDGKMVRSAGVSVTARITAR